MLLKIRVVPGSEKVRIKLESSDNGPYLKIWLKSPAKKGRANRELSRLLKKVFGDYTFVSGATSREKLIKVAGDIDTVIKITREPKELS
ncbi:MAG: DUF167 domain-containing protein [archaeon]|nr:MAG: DUF167 domain-containing protein [archaeon]